MSRMDSHTSMKVNKLLQAWPPGTVAIHPWLEEQGVSRKLAEQYRKRGWIDAIGRGAFVRRGDKVEWPGAVYAMQKSGGKRIHPGGRSALELHGLDHFLRLGKRAPLHLYGAPGERLPTWFRQHDWDRDVQFTATSLFRRDLFVTPRSFGSFAIEVSAPERAILEYLDGLQAQTSFEEARELVEGLTTLRPEPLQALLQACTSVKVKRLFLYLADLAGHPWRAKLKEKRIDLGSGNRLLVRGGKLHPKYRITVPADTLQGGE
jgi:hypothetical protein